MRATAVYRINPYTGEGEWIPTDIVAGPNGYPSRPSPPAVPFYAHSDVIRCEWTKLELEMKSMADGRRYTSKSRYRAEARAHGKDEVGNDPAASREQPRHQPNEAEIRDDVERGWSEANFRGKTKFVFDKSVRRKVRAAKGAGG